MAKPEFKSKFTEGYVFEVPKIEYSVTRERLTGSAGVGNILDLFCESKQYPKLRECLPERKGQNAYDTIQYALSLLAGFWLGADCLEDVEKKGKSDEYLREQLGGRVPTARSLGTWLREFSEERLSKVQSFLSRQARSYREHLQIQEPIVLDMDSTSHPQSGTKIEGVSWNYKDEWCLDSLSCFDDAGFCYGFELRSGNTYSSQGAEVMLERVVQELRESYDKQSKPIYYRADSAFCNETVVRTCLRLGLKFTLTAHGNMKWERFVREHASEADWQAWEYGEEEIQKSIEKKRPLPKVEVASFLYTPSWAENIRFKLVVKRTEEVEEEGLFEGMGRWKYYGVLTNISDYLEEPQAIMEHHMHRGSAENRIKAMKGDYDLRHMPCLKMNANHAYGLLGMIAMNFHRALSLVENPRCPGFSKSLRQRMIKIPGRLVRHARALKIKIEEHWLREVERLRKAWRYPPEIALTFRLRLNST